MQERLAVLERMAAHAQFCLAGDHTLEATALAAEELAAFASASSSSSSSTTDEKAGAGASSAFLFVISDCNLSRYRLDPRELGQALMRHGGVRGHIFMIASLGDEAEQVIICTLLVGSNVCISGRLMHAHAPTQNNTQAVKAMPVGRAHLCLDTSTLPSAFKRIFVDELTSLEERRGV